MDMLAKLSQLIGKRIRKRKSDSNLTFMAKVLPP